MLIQIPVNNLQLCGVSVGKPLISDRSYAELGEIRTAVLMDTAMCPRAPERLRATFPKRCFLQSHHNFFIKMMVAKQPSKRRVKCSKKSQNDAFSDVRGTVYCRLNRTQKRRTAPGSTCPRRPHVALGFFREHRLPLPFPKKPLYSLPTAITAECFSSDDQKVTQ